MQPVLICFLSVVSCVLAHQGNTISDGGVNCSAPREVGVCAGQEEAWFYDEADDRCRFFVFSGCGGNSNRFTTRQVCEETCMENYCPDLDCPASCNTTVDQNGCKVCSCTKEEAAAVCEKPMKRGYCRALYHKWAWSHETNNCVEFVYGGCGGNENSFDSKESCLEVCKGALV